MGGGEWEGVCGEGKGREGKGKEYQYIASLIGIGGRWMKDHIHISSDPLPSASAPTCASSTPERRTGHERDISLFHFPSV